MTEEEVIERGSIYRDFVKHPGWDLFSKELKEKIKAVTEALFSSPDRPMTAERGEVNGIQGALRLPFDAIIEMEELKKGETADQV